MTSPLRQALEDGSPIVGIWSTIAGPVMAGMLAQRGPDFVIIDLQHGAADERDLPAITAAVVAAGSAPLVRVRQSTEADIGRALDLGAHGVFLTSIRDAEHAQEALQACHPPPSGTRSVGRLHGGDDDPLCFLIVETAGALADLDAILAMPGLNGIYVGPRDLAYSIGGAAEVGSDRMQALILDVIDRCHKVAMPVGVHTSTAAEAVVWMDSGVQIVTAAADSVVVTAAIDAHLAVVRQRQRN